MGACTNDASTAATTTSIPPGSTVPVTPTQAVSPSTTVFVSCGDNSLAIDPDPIPVAAATTRVDVSLCWNSAAAAGKRTFVTQCRSDPAAANFDFATECSGLSEITWNPIQASTAFQSFSVFVGTEPSGDSTWGCFPAGVQPPAGVTAAKQCYLRFTSDTESNNASALSIPITFTGG